MFAPAVMPWAHALRQTMAAPHKPAPIFHAMQAMQFHHPEPPPEVVGPLLDQFQQGHPSALPPVDPAMHVYPGGPIPPQQQGFRGPEPAFGPVDPAMHVYGRDPQQDFVQQQHFAPQQQPQPVHDGGYVERTHGAPGHFPPPAHPMAPHPQSVDGQFRNHMAELLAATKSRSYSHRDALVQRFMAQQGHRK